MKTILTKALSLLIVLTLSATSLYAQAPIKKPEKKKQDITTTTTTTQQKPKTSTQTNTSSRSNNSSASTSTSSQTNSSSKTATAPQPTTGTINGHQWVDLGLSVKWATCNVGASSPSDYGNYYAWGEIKTKSMYTEGNSEAYGKSNGIIAGNSQYDAARANWGSTWRMPTRSEIDELVSKCTRTWISQGGNYGYKVTGPNGNSIFLPASGKKGKSLDDVGKRGFYWTATPREGSGEVNRASMLYFNSGTFHRDGGFFYSGRSVRPVSE